MRVALVDRTMPGPASACPSSVDIRAFGFSGVPVCANNNDDCVSAEFTTHGLNYCQVCGQVRGYQQGCTHAFERYNSDSSLSIDDNYVDGVSITTKTIPRQHIWTYAAGVTDMNTGNMGCPCNNNSNVMVPDYVGSNYYCESGTSTQLSCNAEFQQNDPLWDGLQCNNAETTCCPPGSNQPWFNSTLLQISNDSVELRLCTPTPDEDTPVDIIELYIR